MRHLLLFALLAPATCLGQATLTVKAPDSASAHNISRFIYGHFAENLGRCIYDGFWSGDHIRMDVVEALKRIKVPDLRWPGGCFADQYHWSDGIGAHRPTRVNTTWGMVPDNNTFGTDEFLKLCTLIGCEPYIAGNVGSGTPQEMENWLEYLNYGGTSTLAAERAANGHPDPYKVFLWGVGNESWGCGGSMTPEYYTDLFKRYREFCKTYPGSPHLRPIASGPNSDDYNWTEVCMRRIPDGSMYGLSLHYYTVAGKDWGHKGSATTFGEDLYFSALRKCLFMDTLVTRHSAIMDKYDPKRHVALVVDEWGIWTDVEPGTNPAFLYQQNSLRDALIAATTLNIFNNHSERVRMANLAQSVNVLQSLVLTKGDAMVLTPTYYVFDLYKVHQDAQWLPIALNSPAYVFGGESIPAVNVSASRDASGAVHISLVNLDPTKPVSVSADVTALHAGTVSGTVLVSEHFTDVNSFEKPDRVRPAAFSGAHLSGGQLTVTMPASSIVVLELK